MKEFVTAALEHRVTSRLPRGELWIGTRVFEELGLPDDLDAHLRLCQEVGMDFLSLPVGSSEMSPSENRLFGPADIEKATQSDLFVVAVIDGPWQRLVNKRGLRSTLAAVGRSTSAVKRMLEQEAKDMSTLISMCTEQGASAVVVADDLAYNRSTFFSPALLRELLIPFYVDFVERIHRKHAYAIFHSDGNITSIVPDLISAKFDGLSCQVECMDLVSFKSSYGARLALLAGLSCKLLNMDSLTTRQRQRFVRQIQNLSKEGGLVLSSSSGLHSARMLLNAERLYQLVDEA